MTNPTTFKPLIDTIEYALLSGSSAIYPISSSYYGSSYFYEARTQEGLSQDTLVKPQIRAAIRSFEDAKAWLQPNTQTMYDVEIGVELAYHLDSKVLKSKRTEIETKVASDAVAIQKTLTYPGNLLTSSLDGSNTGLVSGRLQFVRYTNPKADYINSVYTALVLFNGKVCLLNG